MEDVSSAQGSHRRFQSLGLALASGLLAGAVVLFTALQMAFLRDGFSAPSSDLAQALSGAIAFLRDEWRFPLFDVEGMTLLGRKNIIFTDSIPIYSLAWKLAGASPETASKHFIPVFMALSFLLQGAVAAWALWYFRVRNVLALFGFALLLTVWPAFLYRQLGHIALSAHWILLPAIVFMLAPLDRGRQRLWVWLFLMVVSLLLHPYLFVICMVCFLTRWIVEVVTLKLQEGRFDLASNLTRLAAVVIASLGLMYAFGHIGSEPVSTPAYSAHHALNLAAPFMPSVYSSIVPNWGTFPLGHAGTNNYFGIAAILLILLCLVLIVSGRGKALYRTALERKPARIVIFAVFACITLYAISEEVYFSGYYLGHLPFPGFVTDIGATFRDHSRFFWLVSYAVLILSSLTALGALRRSGPILLLGIGALAYVEMHTMLKWVQPKPNRIATDQTIRAAIAEAKSVSIHPIFTCHNDAGQHHHVLQLVAMQENVPMSNSFISARTPAKPCAQPMLSDLKREIKAGATAFVRLDNDNIMLLMNSLDVPREACRRGGAFAICRKDWAGSVLADMPPALLSTSGALPTRFSFGKDEPGVLFLAEGFSAPEDWGVWSVGDVSRIVLPISQSTIPGRVSIEIGGFVPDARATYKASVELFSVAENKTTQISEKTVTFLKHESDRATVSFDRFQWPDNGARQIEIRLKVSDARSPLELGVNSDDRKLGVSVFSISVEWAS